MKHVIKVLGIVMLLAACSTTKVLSDIDKGADFDGYKTYAWSDVEEPLNDDYPQYDNSLNRKRWKNAIDAAMQNEGYTLVEENADLQVDYHIQFEHNAVVDHEYHNNPRDYYESMKPTSVYQYDEGIMTIHLIDLERNQVVWQAVLTKVLDISQLDKADSNIRKVVNKAFEKFHSQIAE
ncbi:DUF4136 domain-containing protein [Maribacter sp. 2307ULW6-5]|uniref:DUF4136 domain-containing protein n=1 Tax=Maribacter sp. 2307ULW6-5 TaxID=3386275 RepID=UPI0039BD7D97